MCVAERIKNDTPLGIDAYLPKSQAWQNLARVANDLAGNYPGRCRRTRTIGNQELP
jgi:hypothetical protein